MRIQNLPVFGPTDPHGNEDVTPDVIVRVDYLLSREQLVTALGIGFAEIAPDRAPEALTVAEVWVEVEGFLATQGIFALADQMERDQRRDFGPEQQRVMRLLAEAVDRAYPLRLEQESRVVQAPVHGEGTVTLQTTDRGEVTVPEPAWCTGHEGELVGSLSEVTHYGPEVTAAVDGLPLMRANLTHAPYLEIEPEPHPLVLVEALEAASFDGDELRDLVAAGRAYLDQLEGLAGQLDELAGEGSS